MSNANTDVIIPTDIYSEEYQRMVISLPRGPQLRISASVNAKFREWLATQQVCDTHRLCQIQAHYDRRIDALILNDVFTPDLKTVWALTEPYAGKRSADTQIIRARETHKSLKKIVNYIKEKLCKIAFEDELRARRESIRRYRLEQEFRIHRIDHERHLALIASGWRPDSTVVPVVRRRVRRSEQPPFVCDIENSLCAITEEDADTEMEDDCAICASKHKMMDVCSLNCGHQFGMADCLTPWMNILKNSRKHPTCPCCRTQIKKIVSNTITPIDL